MKKTCILQDTQKPEYTIALLEVARRIYGKGKFKSHALMLRGPVDPFIGIFHHIIRVKEDIANHYDPRGICDILEQLHHQKDFDTILIPATHLGKMIAPRLARRLGTGLAAGVTEIRKAGDQIEIIRPACSGKMVEVIHPDISGPVVLTIRPNMFEYRSADNLHTQVYEHTRPVKYPNTIQQLNVKKNDTLYDIQNSEVLISGGQGVKQSFSELYRLAGALNGQVSASRRLVDQGIAPRSIQVGQTGKTVSPRLYMALGIHGSMQHIAGLRQVELIISVNRSRHAPICSVSDIVVIGDARKFIDRLMEKITIYRSMKKRGEYGNQ